MILPHPLIPLATLALIISLPPWSTADTVWPAPVGRMSNDRDADLVTQLIRLQRYPQAIAICRSSLLAANPESDDGARWAIRLSETLTALQMTKAVFDEAEIAAAAQPVTDLLQAYPQHRRHLFLEAQRINVRRDAAQHDVVITTVSPITDDRIDQTMKRLLRTTTAQLALSEKIADSQAQLSNQRGGREFALISDLVRLQQQLQVDAVSLSLMQTELFKRGSQDQLAAATKAETAAVDAATMLPADSPARREVERLRIEAILRGEQFDRAEMAMNLLLRSLSRPLEANIQAMIVRIDLGRKRIRSADTHLRNFYGTSPDDAPSSIEMDLARLEYLLASGADNGEVGIWLDTIERRNGLYARRRAESISLSRLRSAGTSQAVDPSLVAAQAADWVRRGDHGRAGELFAAAAMAERDGARAIRHATGAAAALVRANRSEEAAEILEKVAIAHRSTETAPAAHLQSAVLHSSSGADDAATKIEAILTANLKSWPTSSQAPAARRWLVKLLSTQMRHLQAAQAATPNSDAELTPADLETAIAQWQIAISTSKPEKLKSVMHQFQESFRPVSDEAIGRAAYRSAAAYLLDREFLAGLPPLANPPSLSSGDTGFDSVQRFCEALLTFRIDGTVSPTLDQPPDHLVEVVTWRLMRDGRDYPQLRAGIADLIDGWPSGRKASMNHAERLLWLQQVTEAVTMLRTLIAASPQPGEAMSEAAELLGSSDQRAAKSAAIAMWDELAAGIPQGSERWHIAKLNAIRLLAQSGQREESQRRAKYILLTAPPKQPALKQQYQSASKP